MFLVGFHINFAYFPYYIKHIIGPAGDKLRSVAALKETFISDVHAITGDRVYSIVYEYQIMIYVEKYLVPLQLIYVHWEAD